MSDFLESMASSSRARAADILKSPSDDRLDRPLFPLRLDRFDLIAEIKNRSPAEGELSANAGDRVARAFAYVSGGAAAISVLTEPDRFDGELSHLEEIVEAVAATETPVMRKDFLVDVLQVLEARAAGASGILLIAAILDDDALASMLDCAFEHGLFVLLETFDEEDLGRCRKIAERSAYREQAARNKLLVGVNTRNLRTLEVDPERLEQLGPLLPEGVTCVAESGIVTAADAARVVGWGYNAVLVGTALMRADDPEALVRDMLAAGRSA
jgi:indole-3-glycerol phosphate synthase